MPGPTVIPATHLICMDPLAAHFSFRVELAYAREDNLLFGERIYRPDAKLFLQKDLAHIVCHAALYCAQNFNARFILYDGLRTSDAQAKMMDTNRVRENPHWLEEPRLLSPPGTGGHPRAMAIDIGLETLDGKLLDMGTPFDYLAENAAADHNPAHRDHPHLSAEIRENRKKLDQSMEHAARISGQPLTFLPQEWWDFRFPADVYNLFAPIAEADLPPEYRLLDIDTAITGTKRR